MNIMQFLEHLKGAPSAKVTPKGRIRIGKHCPITYVAWQKHKKHFKVSQWILAAELLNLSEVDAVYIAWAADKEENVIGRAALLKALGVK